MPWLNVVDNVAFALKMRGLGKRERHVIARETLALVGLAEFGDRIVYDFPAACSSASASRARSPPTPRRC